LKKTGAGFALAALKNIDKCTSALFKCLELTGGDPVCFTKSCKACHPKLPIACQDCHREFDRKDSLAKLVGNDEDACGAVSFAQTMKTTGLGYELREAECTDVLGGSLTTVNDIGYCTALQHDCQAATLFATALPRARELIAMCDDVPISFPFELECLPDHGTGGMLAGAASRSLSAASHARAPI
jgi:hypothetical protein